MPALDNPRHEAFAQAIFAGLTGKTRIERAQSTAYLQAEANKRIQPKLDISKETIGRRLRIASEMAEQDRNPNGITAAELGIAKVFHRLDTQDEDPADFTTARNMTDVGRKLLQSVGFKEPDDVSIQAAIEANDAFIDR